VVGRSRDCIEEMTKRAELAFYKTGGYLVVKQGGKKETGEERKRV